MINVAVIGVGLVGSELLVQLRQSPIIRVVALSNSKRMLLANPAISLVDATWTAELESKGTAASLSSLIEHGLRSENLVVVDCTSSDAVAAQYPTWLDKGIHIVTPNKKGFSGDLDLFLQIKRLTSSSKPHPWIFHESTVGAGLPILSTLNDLINTGDKVLKIEGIFSGTLSYIFNNFSTLDSGAGGKKFSEIVKVAKEFGYTEPDPRDDLNGLDVARKVIILGRVASLQLSLSTLAIENIVPEPLREVATAQEFLSRLPEFDPYFEQLNNNALVGKQVLRYVGLVDLVDESQSGVKLVRYESTHPFASLKGSDNIIKFTTQRFPNGLIVQGAGAGAAVTAFGIHADLLKVNRLLGGTY